MIKKLFKSFFSNRKGIALFVSILISMSLAVTAVASMARLSETTHQTGKTLQEKRLLMFAESAANIVNGELEQILVSEIAFGESYLVHGVEDEKAYVYYPKDVSLNPGTTGRPTLFGYRANARLYAVSGQTPPGLQTGNVLTGDTACYDITIDVVEIILAPSGMVTSEGSDVTTPSFRYYKGKMKTVGVISCFDKG